MPTYDYVCEHCSHEFEEYQAITARPLRKCPACTKPCLRRRIGAGGGVIFKGSGFYETDYRSASYKKSAESDKPATSTEKPDASKKPDTAPVSSGSAVDATKESSGSNTVSQSSSKRAKRTK